MKIIADSAIPFLQGVLEPWAEVRYLPGAEIAPEEVRDADALLIRTRTRCDKRLLGGSRVRLIATATIGFDHIDTAWCAAHGVPSPADDAALMRLIFDSLAAKYAEVLGKLRRLAPFEIECLHVIGGGAQNDLLNRMTADAVGIPVVAGPAEATALGNIMVQARAAGVVSSLAEMRRYIGRSIETKTYQPKK